ncbi:unnamed protein product [Diabrotica balteata]|uniref:DnaJ homolog subfamily C member 21 n=1 Tax=Diabrotica balteata TaxID=107213 RepID=A0A9N9XDA9_DIABA|nr:unnamed protein product [Diabrotica balteata]
MKCHYEVLSVSRDADDSEIKTAYRKLALKWHPDKNLDNADLAKEQFQIVQQAYDVLSDRQERAWYDNHREQILRGSSSDFQDNSLDVFQYFTTTCFNGYGDDENGFYTIYRNVFEKISKEEMDFMEDKEEFCSVPSFGNSTSDFEVVSEFYAYWLNYATKKSFVWLDPYDIKDIRDRRYLKMVEKENKKIRQKAKKERSEEVRNLAAFVKKRDKRVQAQKKLQEQKLLEDKKKRESLSKQKRLERREELEKAKVSSQAEWTKFDNVKTELEQIERNLAEQFGDVCDSDEEDELDLYCVACSKLFKTPKAFENHESSKKHKENVEILKETMLEEEEILESGEEISDNENQEDENNLKDNQCMPTNEELDDVHIESDETKSDSESIEESNKNKKKKKKSNVINHHEEECSNGLNFEVSSDDFDFDSSTKKQKKKTKKNTKNKTNEAVKIESEELQENHREEKPVPKSKKERKTAKDMIKKEIPDLDINHSCVTCKSAFPSKNKLFDHLKKTGHGIYIPPNVKNKKASIKTK